MEHNVLLHIKGIQRYEGNGPEAIELSTEGRLFREKDCLVLTYEESELTGLDGTTTRFELRPDNVRLIRTGKVRSVMEFIPGQTNQSLYDTGMGALLVTSRTLKIRDEMGEDGGNLSVTYHINIENLGAGEIEYAIVATPLGE